MSVLRGLFPHLRAAFVAFHIAAVCAFALPNADVGMNPSSWRDPTVRAEFARWAGWLRVPPDVLTERLWDIGTAWHKWRRQLVRPFERYRLLSGTDQNWQMFVAPHRFPTRLQIRIETPAGWEVVFEERSETATWHAETFGLEILRSMVFRWGWPTYNASWERACKSFAVQLFAERPDASSVECRFHKAASPSPGEAATGTLPEGEWVLSRVVSPDGSLSRFKKKAP